MKFTSILKYFLDALLITERATSKTAALPVLQHVLIRTEKNKVTLAATNLEIAIRSSFQAKTAEDGAISVPTHLLRGFLMNATEEKITAEFSETILTLQAGSQDIEIKGLSEKDFPIIPAIKDGATISLPGPEFFSAISSLVPFAAIGDVRPELCGIFCSFEGEQVRMAATDSFRLGELVIKNIKNDVPCQFIIPLKTATELSRIFEGADDITLTVGANQIMFKSVERELVSRLVEGKYPDYTAIIPVSFTTNFHMSRDAFMRALRAASMFSVKNNETSISLLPEKKLCGVENKHADYGEYKNKIEGEGKGKDLIVSCNYKYLLDALSGLDDEIISIEGNKDNEPLLIKGSARIGARYLVMPLRPY